MRFLVWSVLLLGGLGGEGLQLTLLGLWEVSSPGGQAELGAVELAVRHVNQIGILRPHSLRVYVNDTKCDPGMGVDTFFHALYTRPQKVLALLGGSCSSVMESLAKVAPYWDILQVSWGATSPALSDRSEFPLFFRTVAPDSSHNPGRLSLLRAFSWTTVSLLAQDLDIYSLGMNDLVTALEEANISCKAAVTFSEGEISSQLRALKELDTRIIIGNFSPFVAAKVFCEAKRLGMYGSDYGWLIAGSPSEEWWLSEETQADCSGLKSAADGVILVTSHSRPLTDSRLMESLKIQDVESSLEEGWKRYSREAYDAVWSVAMVLSRVKTGRDLTRQSYGERKLAWQLAEQLAQLNFTGMSGPVTFDGPDRIGITAFYQIQENGVSKMIGRYEAGRLSLPCRGCAAVRWPGTGQRPVAQRLFRTRTVSVHYAAFMTVAFFAGVGIVLSFAFLAVNLHYRKHKYIKLSSPKLNNVAVVGCMLVYFAVILLGMDTANLPSPRVFPTVCTARVYLLSAGFSMGFGSIFAKTYRVHRIFTRSARGVVKNKLLQDTQLISLICILLVVDGLIVTLWVTVDPIERQLRNLTLEMSPAERSIVYQPQIEVCSSTFIHSWLGALYVYKGLLLAVGVYMAWETRHVKVAALNDSQYIGLSVYSVVITSALVVVLSGLVPDRVTLAFLLVAGPILLLTTGCLCLLFLPKLQGVLGFGGPLEGLEDPVSQSMGLKIECNTRRFVGDDRRELHFRVEVQNKVYRRDLHRLDTEIQRLERQLARDVSSASSCASSSLPIKTEDEELAGGGGVGRSSLPGGLPLLLLSVLPPLIPPRASWPTEADTSLRDVMAFSSEPKLLGEPLRTTPRASRIGIPQLRAASASSAPGQTQKLSVLGRFLQIISPGGRKSSAPGCLASALRANMEHFAAGFAAPGPQGAAAAHSSGSLESTAVNPSSNPQQVFRTPYLNVESYYDWMDRKFSLGTGEEREKPEDGRHARSVQSLAQHHHHQPRVSFSLQQSQPILSTSGPGSVGTATWSSGREAGSGGGGVRPPHAAAAVSRRSGSPRFPHRIVPTSSLGDLKKRDQLNLNVISSRVDIKSRSLEETREKRVNSLDTTNSSGGLWFDSSHHS